MVYLRHGLFRILRIGSSVVSMASIGYSSQVQHVGTQTELDQGCLSDILMKELAASKNKCTEMSTELERKKLDLRQALQREAAMWKKLQIAKDPIGSLEDKVKHMHAQTCTLTRAAHTNTLTHVRFSLRGSFENRMRGIRLPSVYNVSIDAEAIPIVREPQCAVVCNHDNMLPPALLPESIR